LKKISKVTPLDEQKTSINALSTLLDLKGLDASDFIDVINALGKIKKRNAEKEAQQEEKGGTTHYLEKEFVFETRKDVFIYRSGATKSGRYYIRIYDEKTKRDFVQSLRTTNRIEALAKAEEIYAERKNSLRRGVKTHSLTTKELVKIYLNERIKTITTIPHQGITKESFNTLVKHLKYWQEYIESRKYGKSKIEDIPPDIGKGFGIWMKEQKKQRYQERERSNETINHTIVAVKKMYKDIAIGEKYITMAEFPNFRLLKVNRDKAHKRDIIEPEEFTMLRRWMANTWCREKGISELERTKRYVYSHYLIINYLTGCRNKEMLGLRWGDISTIKHESKESQRINRAIFIPAENSKTGKSRTCVAPVAFQFERIKEHYKKIGITSFNRTDYIFINLAKTKRGTNTPYDQPAMEKRLKAVIEGSGLKKILDETGRHITQYSARHYAVTEALMRGVSIYDVALNLGTSIHYIEQTYSKITALKKSKEITRGQGIYKVIEEQATSQGKEYQLTDEGNVKVGAVEYTEDPNYLKLNYGEYYSQLSDDVKKEEDFSWLEFMEMDPRIPREEVEEVREQVIKKWGLKN
jgi:integrase